MAVMWSRNKIAKALDAEFRDDALDSRYWIIDKEVIEGRTYLSVNHIGAPGRVIRISAAAGRGYAVRAYKVVKTFTEKPVEVTVTLASHFFLVVSDTIGGESWFFGEGKDGYWAEPVTVLSKNLSIGEPCIRCSRPTDGIYARNILGGLRLDMARRLYEDYATPILCEACIEAWVVEASKSVTDPDGIRARIGLIGSTSDKRLRRDLLISVVNSGQGAVEPLIEALTGENPTISEAARVGLTMFYEAAIPQLLEVISGPDDEASRRAMFVIRTMSSGGNRQRVLDALLSMAAQQIGENGPGGSTTATTALQLVEWLNRPS